MPPVSKSISQTHATGAHHELQIYCFTRTGHDSVGLFHRQRAGRTRLRSGRMAERLGPMPLCRSRYCSIGPGRLCGACGPRVELCLPARILAWTVGTLPQHALSWPSAERDVSVTRQGQSRSECTFCRRICIARMSFSFSGGFSPTHLSLLWSSHFRKSDARNRRLAAIHLYWVDRH
jgi:hypothetical protein